MFKPSRAALLLFFLAADLYARCVAHTSVQPPPAYAAAVTEARKFPVGVNGKVVWSAGFGKVGETTPMRIGSISKPIAADVFALLLQQGKLDPDAPVDRYVANLPEALKPITSRQLAGHLGGIRHYVDNEFYSNKHFANVTEGLSMFENDPLVAPPGTKYNSRVPHIRTSRRYCARWFSSRCI